MPKTISITAYTFDELSDKAKERARWWWREGGLEYNWWDATYEDAKICFGYLGFTIKDIFFSGFSSQGDGACFVGTWRASYVKPGKLKEHAPQDEELHRIAAAIEALAVQYPGLSCRITHHDRYTHKYTASFEIENHDTEDEVIDHPEAVEKEFIELARDLMQWLYDSLEKEYQYLNSDESVDECIRINGYLFTDDGKRTVSLNEEGG